MSQDNSDLNEIVEDRDAPSGSAWHSAHRVLLIVGAAALVLWILSGIYYVSASEVAVVERCGEYITLPNGQIATESSGIHVGLPWPLDRVEKIARTQSINFAVKTFDTSSAETANLKREKITKGLMRPEEFDAIFNPSLITADLNVVYANVTVTYYIDNPGVYLMAVAEMPGEDLTTREQLLTRLIERDMVAIISHAKIDTLLGQRGAVDKDLFDRVKNSMGAAETGIRVDNVVLSTPHVADAIKPAFDNVNTNLRLKGSKISEAQRAAKEMELNADANASNIKTEANNYRSRILDTANGEADRFFAFYQQACKNPEIAWLDIWSDAVRDVYKNASRVYYVVPGQRIYVPIPPPDKTIDNPADAQPQRN